MNFVSWSDWLKGILSFFSLVVAILLFDKAELDTYFLITFILAIISIFISVIFFIKSNSVSNETKILISEMKGRLQEIKERMLDGSIHSKKISDEAIVPKKEKNDQ